MVRNGRAEGGPDGTEGEKRTNKHGACSKRSEFSEQGHSVLSGAALRGSLQRKDLAPGASPRTETSGNLRSSKGIPGSGKSGQRNRKGNF